jgi:hypothetical protein
MNSVEKELHGYIAGTERMSGFDDSDDNMSFFDDDAMSYFDDDSMSYASGASQSVALSDPYVIQYQNTTAGALTAILFGYNDYYNAANFGNPAGIVITNLQSNTGPGTGYGRLLAQSNNKEFKIGKWRFQSATSSQLQQTLQLVHVDGNGKSYSTPLNLSIMRDAYQQQSDILDVTKVLTIDGNAYISFTLIALATLVISMFPVSVLSAKAKLNGGQTLNNAKAPRLSGKNVAPVIIQTSEAVKGIAAK